jgi:hypothetical protein
MKWLTAAVMRGLIGGLLAVLSAGGASALERITYNRNSALPDDPRPAYSIGLLKLALGKVGIESDIQPHTEIYEQSRSIAELAQGRSLRMIWTGTSPEREEQLRPVRIPLDRGLLGVRLLLVRPDMVPRIAAFKGPEELRDLLMGQGIGWPDLTILNRGGFRVMGSSYDMLFTLLDRGRIDAFPRASFEIRAEQAVHAARGTEFAIAPKFAIAYRFTSFFFLNKRDEALAREIERGLMMAYDDGSFMAYFRSHPYTKDVVEALHLAERQVLLLDNPLLSPETRAIPDRFWEYP